jgi:hypothetical protein
MQGLAKAGLAQSQQAIATAKIFSESREQGCISGPFPLQRVALPAAYFPAQVF